MIEGLVDSYLAVLSMLWVAVMAIGLTVGGVGYFVSWIKLAPSRRLQRESSQRALADSRVRRERQEQEREAAEFAMRVAAILPRQPDGWDLDAPDQAAARSEYLLERHRADTWKPKDGQLAEWTAARLSTRQMQDRILEDTTLLVTAGTIGDRLDDAGLRTKLRMEDFIPWVPITREHGDSHTLRMLRCAMRSDAGIAIDPTDQVDFDSWTERLTETDSVVDYNTQDGFHYVPRRRGIDPEFIRIPAVRERRPPR